MCNSFENIVQIALVSDTGEKILEIIRKIDPKIALITIITTSSYVGLKSGLSKDEFIDLISNAWDCSEESKNKKI